MNLNNEIQINKKDINKIQIKRRFKKNFWLTTKFNVFNAK